MRSLSVPRSALAVSAGFAVLFTVSVFLGRLTVMDGTSLSLVWPAAGVAALWFAVQRRAGTRRLDVVLLSGITFAVNVCTGASPALAACFVAANLVQVTLFHALFERFSGSLWGAGGDEPLTGTRQLGGLLGPAVLSTASGGLIGPMAVWLLAGHWSWVTAAVWMTRNTVSIVLILTIGVRIGYLATSSGRSWGSGSARLALPFLRLGAWRRLELAALVTSSAVAYALVFVILEGLPLAFPLLLVTVWAALRFDTTIVVVHDFVVGVAAVLLTLHGDGPFAAIGDDSVRAIVVQAFVGLVALVGLTLALGRDEREVLLRQVRSQAAAASAQVEHVQLLAEASRSVFTAHDPRVAMCQAVRDLTGADGAYLMEPDGRGDLVSTAVVGLDLPALAINLTDEPSLTGTSFQQAQHIFVPDVPGHPGVSLRVQQALGVESAAWQPVLAHGTEAVGVFGLVWHRRVDVLPAHVPAMLQTLAAEAAHAIERGDLLARLALAADRDTLTGLANRRRWDESAEAEVARASRTGLPLTFALIDLDHFKRYNDTLGHLAGDALLRDFATAAVACLRDVDTLARWGGEEFALALPGCSAEEAVAVADRIRSVVPGGQTCTIGIAPWSGGTSAADVLAAADSALYRGKENGRDATVLALAPVTSA